MPKRQSKDKSQYQNMTAWEKQRGEYMINGILSFTPEFLAEILDRFEDGDPSITDDYNPDDVRIKLGFTLRESDYDSVDFFGSVYVQESDRNEKRKLKRGRSRRD